MRARMAVLVTAASSHHPAQGRCSGNGLTINHSGLSVWEEGQVWALWHQQRVGGARQGDPRTNNGVNSLMK